MPERPVFGVDRDPGVIDASVPRAGRNKDGSLKENPMPALYGPGPADKRCRDCVHFIVFAQGGRWFKCDLRRMSSSTVTDHRARWPTCGKFEEYVE